MSKSSTDQVSPKKFRPHGRVTLEIYESGIVKYKAIGPFNDELIEALGVVEEEMLADCKAKFGRWCEVVVFEESCLSTGEVLQTLEAYLKKMKCDGLDAICSAFIFKDGVEGRDIMPGKYEQCYVNAGVLFKSFTGENEALEWVRSQLACL